MEAQTQTIVLPDEEVAFVQKIHNIFGNSALFTLRYFDIRCGDELTFNNEVELVEKIFNVFARNPEDTLKYFEIKAKKHCN